MPTSTQRQMTSKAPRTRSAVRKGERAQSACQVRTRARWARLPGRCPEALLVSSPSSARAIILSHNRSSSCSAPQQHNSSLEAKPAGCFLMRNSHKGICCQLNVNQWKPCPFWTDKNQVMS